jgi:hypothetical protein
MSLIVMTALLHLLVKAVTCQRAPPLVGWPNFKHQGVVTKYNRPTSSYFLQSSTLLVTSMIPLLTGIYIMHHTMHKAASALPTPIFLMALGLSM